MSNGLKACEECDSNEAGTGDCPCISHNGNQIPNRKPGWEQHRTG